MKNLNAEQVHKYICRFMDGRKHDTGNSSFDYCFNYFHNLKDQGIACIDSAKWVEQSCLQLAFFLASWGMLRGKILREKSAHFHRGVLEVIKQCDPKVWEIDLPYDDEKIKQLLQLREDIRERLWVGATDTLVTKIMLGVFANVPALDRYVGAAFGGKFTDAHS